MSAVLAEAEAVAPLAKPSPDPTHCPLDALCLIARLHHVAADPAALRHQLAKAPSDAIRVDDLLLAAHHLGLKAKRSYTSAARLHLATLPALALMRDGRVIVLAQCDGSRVLTQDASAPASRPMIEPIDVFAAAWSGGLILVTSRASLAGELARFDFSWFIPSLVKYRRLLGEVLLISLFLQLFALVSPLFFQVVMDKVLVHRGVTTLDVLVIGLVAVVVFESVLNALRAYVFSHTTSRIDVELGARLFRHLLALPLAYFQARRVGDSVARVRELEHIRSFLTGSSLTLVLDVMFSVIFIGVMLLYSLPLTLIVLASLPLYVGLSLAVVPLLRRRLDEKFARGAANQALLVEAITGIQTVKASALEPQLAKRWDDQLAAYVGGAGNDTLTDDSTTSNDIYRWGIGQGNDTINDAGGMDRIEIAAGVASNQVSLTRSGNHLLVGIAGATDVLTVANWYVGAANRVEEIRLADGSVIAAGTVAPLSLARLPGISGRMQRLDDSTARSSALDNATLLNSAQSLVQAMAQFGAEAGAAEPWLPRERYEPQPLLLLP